LILLVLKKNSKYKKKRKIKIYKKKKKKKKLRDQFGNLATFYYKYMSTQDKGGRKNF
jgi:hypothetical protein